MYRRRVQISEGMALGILLAVAGGFMDVYSYVGRGKVFANAQTGNLIFLGIHVSQGEYSIALHYLAPIIAFVIGIALAEVMRMFSWRFIHWRQATVLIEALILAGIAFLDQSHNLLANSLISFVCGVQVESFRKIYGHSFATTMCTGNLRSATQFLVHFFKTGKISMLRRALLYYLIIACFCAGAVFGYYFVSRFHEWSILVASVLLFIGFGMMFVEIEEHKVEDLKAAKE